MRIQTVFYSLQTALHVSGDTFTHHQEHVQTVITASGTGLTVLLPSAVGEESEFSSDSSMTAEGSNTVRAVPEAVITVCTCSMTAEGSNTVRPVPDAVITVYACS